MDYKRMSYRIIVNNMLGISLELFKKGYILMTDPEIRAIEKKLTKKFGEKIRLWPDNITTPGKFGSVTSLSNVPQKYHLIKPILKMVAQQVKRLPVHRRLTAENMENMEAIRKAIDENGFGYVCSLVEKSGSQSWNLIETGDLTLKMTDYLKEESEQISYASRRTIADLGGQVLLRLEHSGITRKLIHLFPSVQARETLIEWQSKVYWQKDDNLGPDYAASKAELLTLMKYPRVTGATSVDRLVSIFGGSLKVHWTCFFPEKLYTRGGDAEHGRDDLSKQDSSFVIESFGFSMSKEDALTVFPKLKDLLMPLRDRIHFSLEHYSEIAVLFMKHAFFEKLKENDIGPEALYDIVTAEITDSLRQQFPTILKRERKRQPWKEPSAKAINKGIAALVKDFPDETEQSQSAGPGM